MKGNTPYLVVDGLKKHYGDGEARVQVLDGITTTVNKGEACVMLGPSGSGKSTFLNLIGGLEGADGGTISVGGCELTSLSDKALGEYRRRELGFVFQFYNLVPDLTIKENIEVTAHLSSNPLPMEDLLRSLGLWEHRNKFPRQVSGGQQQRCAIGRALVKNPRLQDLQGGPRAHGAREPRVRLHPRDRDAQRRNRTHGGPRAAPARRPLGRGRGQRGARLRLRARLVGA